MGCAAPKATVNTIGVVQAREKSGDNSGRYALEKTENETNADRRKYSVEVVSQDTDLRCTPGAFHKEYLLGPKLGSGAFAQVYSAHRVSTGDFDHQVAVKITDLRKDLGPSGDADSQMIDSRKRQTAISELKLLQIVTNRKNCIALLESYIDGCFSYMVTPKYDETLLSSLERDPCLTEFSYLTKFFDILTGLHAIHTVNVIHRDIKPDNFLVDTKNSQVILCDFGLSHIFCEAPLGGIYGTPPFMAPEMLSNLGYGSKADTWSAGVLMYTLILGQFPYKALEGTGKAMKVAIKLGIPAPKFRPYDNIPVVAPNSTLIGLIGGLLVRRPSDRLSAAAALKHSWFNENDTLWRDPLAPSLRPSLNSAKRQGAFTPHKLVSKDKNKMGLDAIMTELQLRHQGNKNQTQTQVFTKVNVSCASTDASTFSLTDSGQSVS